VRNKHLGLFFLLPLRNQEKRKHPATHHLLILTTDILLLLSFPRFSFFFPFSLFLSSLDHNLFVFFSYCYMDAYHLGNVAPLWWVGWLGGEN